MTDPESRKHSKEKVWEVKDRRWSQSEICAQQYTISSVSLGNFNTVTLAISENVILLFLRLLCPRGDSKAVPWPLKTILKRAHKKPCKKKKRNHGSPTVESQTLLKAEIRVVSREVRPKYPEHWAEGRKACNSKAQSGKANGGRQEMGQDPQERLYWTRALRDGWNFYQG